MMRLTPIKIRGKGPRKKVWRPPQPEKFLGASRKAKTPSRQVDRGKNTSIENLPTEVLFLVALECGNPNLLYSSPVFYRRLFTRSFLQELVLKTFSPVWDLWWGVDKKDIPSFDENHETWSKIASLQVQQSRLLEAWWCDIDTILEAQQWWYNRHGFARESFDYHSPWAAVATHPRFPDRFSPKDELDSLPGFEDLSYFRDGGDYGLVARQQHKQGDLHIRDYVEKDLFMFHFPHENREECYEKRPEKKHQEFVEVHPRVRIPNRLLRGPWRWKDAALLFWLLRGGAERSADHTWELTNEGFFNILSTTDEHLASLLLRLFAVMRIMTDELHWPAHIQADARKHVKMKMQSMPTPPGLLQQAQEALPRESSLARVDGQAR